jgi:hypothetical protein
MIESSERLVSHLETSRKGIRHPICAIDTEADSTVIENLFV